ncbi:electron transfer flavoprotein beta subunit lysine methyltransferase-like, partial [Teleopsis dalmanni]|uniref:electron transfer flavoprotein beta subunit lysine methyltransferase-like n=1 Tax=Teleopsis dalmanni TaxID=139649 RepID=UPI0018CD1238
IISTLHSLSYEQLERRIIRETSISRNHLTPEIALHLITPECRLFNDPITTDSQKVFPNDPFWGFYWPGGQALSRYILDHPDLIKGKTVLDVGSGCGASTLASLLCNAKYVVANDIDEVAACALFLNTSLNTPTNSSGLERRIKVCFENLIGTNITEDIVLLGDVFYDEEFAAEILPWLQHLQKAGKHIFIGDPGRHGLTEHRLSFMKKLASYELTDNCCIENNGFKFVNVWKFK